MRKILLTICVLFSLNLNAQLADGSTAPEFDSTDIFGNEVSLSAILAEGKAAFIDISATWCGPCWGFHETHAMSDMYWAYGDGGSQEMAVIFIEGDANTTVEQLYGNGGNTNGDWVTGEPYTIINDDTAANTFSIGYWPTFYAICPSGTLYHIDQVNEFYPLANTLDAFLQQSCGEGLQGVENQARVMDGNGTFYCDPEAVSMSTKFKNLGSNNITNAQFELKENGNTISTLDFTGDVAKFEEGNIIFDPIVYNTGSTYTFEMITINGQAPFNDAAELTEGTFPAMQQAGSTNSSDIIVRVTTDSWPTEISWSITDSSGGVVFEYGPYGESDANTTFEYAVTLPDGQDCYNVNYYDAYGDGWDYNPDAGIQIESEGEIIYDENVGNFGSELNRFSAFQAGNLAVNDVELGAQFAVYPNPSNGLVNIKSQENSDITVINTTGQTVFAQKNVAPNTTLNLNHLPKGVYVIQSRMNKKLSTSKLIIK